MLKLITICASLLVILHNVSGQDVKIPPAFAVGVEVAIPQEKNIHYRKSLGDRDRAIFSMDLTLPRTIDENLQIIEKSEVDVIDVKYSTLHIENKTTTECRVYHIDSKVFGFFYNIWVAILKDLYKLEGGSHTYMGSVKIRGNSVDADWYSRQTVAFSPLTNTNITSYFNWYLLNQKWTEVGSGDNTQGHRRPMMYKFAFDDKINPRTNVTVDYFDWSFRKPYLKEYSISNCYGPNFRKYVKVDFNVEGGTLSKKLTIPEVDRIADKIAEAIGVSVLRISNNLVKQTGNTVSFYTALLADAYEIKQAGSAVDQGKTLVQAFNDLKTKAGQRQIYIGSVGGGVNLRSSGADEGRLNASGPRYTPGAMAGLGIGMLLLGLILAFVIAGAVMYKTTGQNPIRNFTQFKNEQA